MTSGKWQKIAKFQYAVKCKTSLFVKNIFSCHTALVAVSSDKITIRNYNSRPYNKCGVTSNLGFTLIELSIVLVIIGLLVGGVLVGRDLISAAEIRSQINQIENYKSSVNAFKLKYGYLPGDIPDPTASSFGFITRGQYKGQGDGDEIIQGTYGVNGSALGTMQLSGETTVFWRDLSFIKMISGSFITASFNPLPGTTTPTSSPSFDYLFPRARIGNGNYIYAWSGGLSGNNNSFGLSALTSETWGNSIRSGVGLTVQQAYIIDQKIDDALPQAGKVTATYANFNSGWWAAGGGVAGTADTSATTASTTTCYDNGNVVGIQKYSLGINGGNGVNCALSFKFQ